MPVLPMLDASITESIGPTADALAWGGLLLGIVVLLAVDLLVFKSKRDDGGMSNRAAGIASVVWILIAVAFAAPIYAFGTSEQATAYLAGYVVERSLSLDNVFVFLVVMDAFAISAIARPRVLTLGILLALVLRFFFILAGAAALHQAAWLSIPFALILLWTGIRLWRNRNSHDSEAELVEGIKKRLRIAEGDHGHHMTVKQNGKRALTLVGAAFLTIAVVDIIFAVDSVPAILAITTDTYIVFAANAFALLGLRPLFFLVAHLVERLYYLNAALAVLLIFIAIKMGLAEVVGKLPPMYSLLGVAVILGIGVVASLLRDKRQGGTPATVA
ncbi:MAG: TerC/Alx family metal homeostasis membrane protein [Solirubrobacteraceae bacterium]|nr:TerC/Alx family metal homeostasis membrane protein [Solirubrobacteraceae bacterium]